MFKAFSKIWILIILVAIALVGLFICFALIGLFIYPKFFSSCSLPYMSECQTDFDCLSQAECGPGRGIICLPGCYLQGRWAQCINNHCIMIFPREKIQPLGK